MKNLRLITLGCVITVAAFGSVSVAQDTQDKAEQAVQITQGPKATNVSDTSVTLTWTTNNVSSNKVRYRPVTGGDWKMAPQSAGSKDHSVTISGLTKGQTYQYEILSGSNNVRTSGQFTAGSTSTASGSTGDPNSMSAAEANVKVTQGPTVTNITGNSATLKWSTDRTAANYVQYRPTSGGHWEKEWERQGTRDHSLTLSNLQPNQTYEFQVLTRDGGVRTSGQFQTAATAAGTMPDVNAGSAASASSTGVQKVPLYRAYNQSNGGYAFTTSQSTAPSGFSNQGLAGFVSSVQVSGTVPLYAIGNKNGSDYIYTIDNAERQSLLASGGIDGGIVGYVASSQMPGTQPFYRMVNKSTGQHFYTVHQEDLTHMRQNGFHDEGTAGYLWVQ